jgi:predicted  nucleic acid-binding Zn-ribbon protein
MRTATADSQLQHYVNECERLRTRLSEAEAHGAGLKKEFDRIETELKDQRAQCSKHLALSTTKKVRLKDMCFTSVTNEF